jgi:transposase
MVTIGPLSAQQQRALKHLQRRAVGRVSQRAHMVLLSARGYSVAQIASIFEVGEDTVRTWLQRYHTEGADGLADRPRPGRPSRQRLARHLIDAQVSVPPDQAGLVQGCWTVGLVAQVLARQHRLHLSASSIRRYLRAGGWRWARPRLAPATYAPLDQRKVDPAAGLKLALVRQSLASSATVLYLDECEVQLLPLVRAMWMRGERVRVPTPGQNDKRVVFGALNAHTGALDYRVSDRKRAVDFIAFLEQIAQTYPRGEVVLILDNVVTHQAQAVQHWLAEPEHARIRLVWLPKYSAHDHNPIERVWGQLKTAVAANRLHASIDSLLAVTERYLTETSFAIPCPRPHHQDASPRLAA